MWIISADDLYELAEICNKSWRSYPETGSVCVLIGKRLISSKDAFTLGLQTAYRTYTELVFFISSWWYRVNIIPIIVLALDTKLSLRSEHFFFFIWQFFSPQIRLNHSVPLLVSVGPTSADIKTERKCFQCSEWVWTTTLSIHLKIITCNDG